MSAKRKPQNVKPVTEQELARLQGVMDYLKANALKAPKLVDVAAMADLSPFHLHRRFCLAFKTTPKAVTTAGQIDEAKRRMLAGEPLSEIATKCGFFRLSHLSTRFKQFVGMPPTQWINEQRSSAGSSR